jgi:3-mercaptopyruvate sulfurtransferase SseA
MKTLALVARSVLFACLGLAAAGSDARAAGAPVSVVVSAGWLADHLGKERLGVLHLHQWTAEGRPVTKEIAAPKAGQITPHPRPDVIVDAEWVRARLHDPAVAIVDTRTKEFYTGESNGRGQIPHLYDGSYEEWSANPALPIERAAPVKP